MDDLRSSASFIVKSMEDKSLLITGVTGFLGKVFMEEVLRVQPNVKKLYLLLRAQDTKSATRRFHQVLEKEVFNVLRKQHGEGFNSFISSKVVPLAGDVSLKNLGITDFNLEQEMHEQIHFIVNVAANTRWDERYDISLSVNTLGAEHVCEFAKKCQKLELLLHVSTAYVSHRNKEGLIFETPIRMDESLNGKYSKSLSIDSELKIAEQRLKQLSELEQVTETNITNSMKELGMQRTKYHGRISTYALTKVMGEMVLEQLKEKSLPLVIIRCTLITSAWKQPFPGWIEGFKGIDALVHNYGKGVLTHSVADPDSFLDVIPVDIVVNAMMVAMAVHRRSSSIQHLQLHPTARGDQEEQVFIYHVGSSSRNPIKYHHLANWAYDYFTKNPHLAADRKPIQVPRWTLLPTMESFSKYATLNLKQPLEALRVLVNDLSCNKSFEDLYNKLNRQYLTSTRLMELFEPVFLFKGIFDTSNLVKLGTAMKEAEDLFGNSNSEMVKASSSTEMPSYFDIDPENIDWEDYFMKVHFPGSTKYAFNSNRSREPVTKSSL